MRSILPILVVLALAGCSATHNVERTPFTGVVLNPEGNAYVATPEDGRYGEIVYYQSGYLTAVAVSRAFTPHFKRTVRGSLATDRRSAQNAAKAGGYTYLILPEILHWEDRATEWSGLPDRIEVRISIIDVTSGDLLDVAHIDAQSKWATLGGDRPEHLLNEPVFDYANSLFR